MRSPDGRLIRCPKCHFQPSDDTAGAAHAAMFGIRSGRQESVPHAASSGKRPCARTVAKCLIIGPGMCLNRNLGSATFQLMTLGRIMHRECSGHIIAHTSRYRIFASTLVLAAWRPDTPHSSDRGKTHINRRRQLTRRTRAGVICFRYSYRRQHIGSTEAARRAGIRQAVTVTNSSNAGTAVRRQT